MMRDVATNSGEKNNEKHLLARINNFSTNFFFDYYLQQQLIPKTPNCIAHTNLNTPCQPAPTPSNAKSFFIVAEYARALAHTHLRDETCDNGPISWTPWTTFKKSTLIVCRHFSLIPSFFAVFENGVSSRSSRIPLVHTRQGSTHINAFIAVLFTLFSRVFFFFVGHHISLFPFVSTQRRSFVCRLIVATTTNGRSQLFPVKQVFTLPRSLYLPLCARRFHCEDAHSGRLRLSTQWKRAQNNTKIRAIKLDLIWLQPRPIYLGRHYRTSAAHWSLFGVWTWTNGHKSEFSDE